MLQNTEKDYCTLFINACRHGNLITLQDIIKNLQNKENSFIPSSLYSDGIKLACGNGHLDIVQYYFESHLLRHINGQVFSSLLNAASQHGQLTILQYLIEEASPTNSQFSLVSVFNRHDFFKTAFLNQQDDILNYLYSIPKLYKPNIIAYKQEFFNTVCAMGTLSTLKKFLNIDPQYGIIDLSLNDNAAWKKAVSHQNTDILNHLLSFPVIKNKLKEKPEYSSIYDIRNNSIFIFLLSVSEVKYHFILPKKKKII